MGQRVAQSLLLLQKLQCRYLQVLQMDQLSLGLHLSSEVDLRGLFRHLLRDVFLAQGVCFQVQHCRLLHLQKQMIPQYGNLYLMIVVFITRWPSSSTTAYSSSLIGSTPCPPTCSGKSPNSSCTDPGNAPSLVFCSCPGSRRSSDRRCQSRSPPPTSSAGSL